MSTVTISAGDTVAYHSVLTPTELRLYANQDFTTSEDIFVAQGSQGNPAFYQSIPVTVVSSTTLRTTSTAGIYTTTDSNIPTVGYTIVIYSAAGQPLRTVYTNFKIPPTPSTTTFSDLLTYNSARIQPARSRYYDVDQINSLLDGLDLAPDASDVIEGKVRLDTVPVDLNAPIAVGSNSVRVTKVLSADYSNSLATAISSISSTPTVLVIKADTTPTTAITVPTNVYLKFENAAQIIKGGSATITFQGFGLLEPDSKIPIFSGFAAGNITWSGTLLPSVISTELWDTANTSLTDRVSRADAAFPAKHIQINAYPRTINGSVRLTQYHHLHFTDGNYPNTLATYGGTGLQAFLLDSNTKVSGSNLAFINESPTEGNCYLFYAYPMRTGGNFTDVVTNIIIENLNIIGNELGIDPGNGSIIQLGNCHNSFVRHCKFYRAHGYGICLGGYGTAGTYAYNSGMHDNLFIGMGSMVANILNGKNCFVRDNHFDQTSSNGTSTYVVMDMEPNTSDCVLDNIVIEGNTADFTNEVTGGPKYGGFIVAQAANIAQVRNITIRGNTAIGRYLESAANALAFGITAVGVEGLVLENNTLVGPGTRAYEIQNCLYVSATNNKGSLLGDSTGNYCGLYLDSVAAGVVSNNEFYAPYTTGTHATGIFERELDFHVTSSGSTITSPTILGAAYRFYDFWASAPLVFTLNNTDYTVATVNNAAQTLTTTVSVGTLAVESVASASDVNTGTDTITFGAHNFINGARLYYTAGSVAIGGLTTATTYFVVGATATTVQLALTLAGAVIDLTGTGTGTQTFTPVLKTKFSSNKYRDNLAPVGITLEPTGTSLILGDYSRTINDWITPAQITSNQNNYNPGRNAYRLDLSTDTSRNLTGLVFTSPPQLNGEKHIIKNVGSFNIVLVHQSGSSTVTNRFFCNTSANITLLPYESAHLEYGTDGFWFVTQDLASSLVSKVLTSPTVTTKITPTTDDGAPLGDTTHNFSDLFLATGAVINYQAGNLILTHSSGILTMGTGEMRVTNAGTNTASVVTVGGTQTLTNKTLTTPVIGIATGTSLAVTGLLTSSGTAGIGYAVGAGSTVVQATSKATAFTLSKLCGQITFAADQLDADETNSATWTNTTIAATDVVIFNHVSGGTIGAYKFDCQCGAGTATINITNITAGNLSQAPVVSFAVIKSVTS